jgi:serine phosphatase RsbU (regulator of sigma subunit)
LKIKANKLLEEQNQIIEEKNGLITESIEYAKTIQEAMVTSSEYFQSIFSDHFVLFQPKDIVSGDFYWAYKDPQSGRIYWAAADCTGHGVPGAFMTIVGIALLNEIVVENSTSEPALILDKLRDLVIKSLNKESSLDANKMMRNGMDIALCCYDPSQNKVLFSGANNPMFIVRGKELLEFKGNKQPIGIYRKMTPFEQVSVDLLEGDLIYIFSDGYADQMNEENQRFKLANLKSTLLEISDKNFVVQKQILSDTYANWKGNSDQIDDVIILGIRI